MKLTNAIRTQIVDAAVKASEVPNRRAVTKARLKLLAAAAAARAVTLPEALANLPKEVVERWVRHTSTVEIRAPGFNRGSHFHGGGERDALEAVICLDDPLPVPQLFVLVDLKDFPGLLRTAETILKYHQATNEIEDGLRASLRAIVNSTNTTDQLLTTWPEGKQFVPAPKPASVGALVDVKTVRAVNKALGLKGAK